MKAIYVYISIISFFLFISAASFSNEASVTSENSYFGETPPGLVPKVFHPKILSTDDTFEGGIFSPDMKEFYFTRINGNYERRTFFVIRLENNVWGKESETDIKWPQFSEDGNLMYSGKEYRLRTETGWSPSNNQGKFLKDQAHGISLSSRGTYYFAIYKKEDNGLGNLGYARLIDGQYSEPVILGPEVNSGKWIAHPYIAPDESYLMWDVVRDDGFGQADIYISFRNKEGSWLPAINMGSAINTEDQESSPYVTADGKYLFFSRGRWKTNNEGTRKWEGKSHWVDARVIENLRPEQ